MLLRNESPHIDETLPRDQQSQGKPRLAVPPSSADGRTYNFYLRPRASLSGDTEGTLPEGYRCEVWKPKLWHIMPMSLRSLRTAGSLVHWYDLLFYWLFQNFAIFAKNRKYEIVLILHGKQTAHYSVVRTCDFRFPFMQYADIQVGPAWTHPSHRHRGLASLALAKVVNRWSAVKGSVWWICLQENNPSNLAAMSSGFNLVGVGYRTARFGLRPLGHFVIQEGMLESRVQADFTIITETPATRATADQLSVLQTRYQFAASFVKGMDVLEAACGAGIGLGLLDSVGAHVTGGDINEENLRFAQETYRNRPDICIQPFDAQRMPFEDESFDVVLLFEALYYLTDPDSFVEEAQRVLRYGGRLLISTVNCRWPGFCPTVYTRKYYDCTELPALLRSHGFQTRLFAGFPENRIGLKAKTALFLRRIAIHLHLIPRSMKGKEFYKRLFYGKLAPVPREIFENSAPCAPLVEVTDATDTTQYRILYALAQKS